MDGATPVEDEELLASFRGAQVASQSGSSPATDDDPDLAAFREATANASSTSAVATSAARYPRGLLGSVRANLAGQYHGLSQAFGLPGDAASAINRNIKTSDFMAGPGMPLIAGARAAGLLSAPPSGDPYQQYVAPNVEHFLPTSKWIRRGINAVGQSGLGVPGILGREPRITYDDVNEVPETYRAQARFGEAVGGGYAPFIGFMSRARSVGSGAAEIGRRAASLLSREGGEGVVRAAPGNPGFELGRTNTNSALGNILNQQVAAAATNPRNYARVQGAGSIGAGLGGYAAETALPGNDTAQMVGQLAGGLFGSVGAGGNAGILSRLWGKATQPFATEEGAKTALGRSLAPHFERAGENVDDVISRLSTPDAVPGALPAERSGSRVLMGVQNTLSTHDENLANALAGRQGQFRQNVQGAIEEGFQGGDTSVLRRVAQQQDEYLQGVLQRAANEAVADAAQVSGNAPATREAINISARRALDRALEDARLEETRLWRQVPDTEMISPAPILAEYDAVRAGMLESDRLPRIIEQEIRRIRDLPLIPFRDARLLRSELMNYSRMAAAGDNPDGNLARRLNQIASGPPGGEGGALAAMSSLTNPEHRLAVLSARNFSTALHDRFSRSFAGDVLGLSDTGEPAVRPGLTLERAFSGKPATVAQQLRELRSATEPPGMGPPRGVADTAAPMGEAQESFLRSVTQRFVSPQTGRINPSTAANWMRDNAQTLSAFPQYRAQLERAIASELGAQQVAGTVADATAESAFGRILRGGEKPVTAVSKILNGNNPVADFGDLVTIARLRGGEPAIAGLRSAVFGAVADAATSAQGLSFQKFNSLLTSPLMRGGPSILQLMQDTGVISTSQRAGIMERLRLGLRHETAPGQAVRIDKVGDEASQYFRWAARIFGVKLASAMGFGGGGAGPSLQIANIAASAAEQRLAKLPIDKARQIISRAMQSDDPAELIDILERIGGVNLGRGTGLLSRTQRGDELISLLRPLIPRTESKPTIHDVSQNAMDVLRDIQLGNR